MFYVTSRIDRKKYLLENLKKTLKNRQSQNNFAGAIMAKCKHSDIGEILPANID